MTLAPVIVRRLLDAEEFDPKDYALSGLKRKIPEDWVSFGFAVDITDGYHWGSLLKEMGVRETPATNEQLNADCLTIEENALKILGENSFTARDEGHSDSSLVGTAWAGYRSKAWLLMLELLGPDLDNNEPYLSTSDGSMHGIEVSTKIFDGVSATGQRILDATISFFDLDKFKEAAHEIVQEDSEDPKDYALGTQFKFAPRPQDVKFYLWVEQEDHEPDWDRPSEHEDPEGAASFDRMMREVGRRLARGDNWAYGIAIVAARFTDPQSGETYEGNDNLGGCSYADRDDFMRPGGYFDDMKVEAFEELLKNYAAGKTAENSLFEPPDGSEVPKEFSGVRK